MRRLTREGRRSLGSVRVRSLGSDPTGSSFLSSTRTGAVHTSVVVGVYRSRTKVSGTKSRPRPRVSSFPTFVGTPTRDPPHLCPL